MAVAAVAAIGIAASQVGLAAQVRLDIEINAHWRGAYDILVRPRGATLDLERTNGLVEPNFVSLAAKGGMSQAQLEGIRAIRGVEIAAPIAWVGLMTTTTMGPTITIPRSPAETTLYSVSMTVSVNDGLSERLVYKDQFRVLLQSSVKADGHPIALSDYGNVGLSSVPGYDPIAQLASTHFLPPVQSPILAVDPAAEKALLGDQGAFFDPLVQLQDRDNLTAGNADPSIVLRDYALQRDQIGFLKQGNEAEQERPVLPILVSSTAYSHVKVSINVSQVGHPIGVAIDTSNTELALARAEEAAGPILTPIGTSTVDASGIRAFRVTGYMVPWPGTTVPEGVGESGMAQGSSVFTSSITDRPTYTATATPDGAATVAFWISPLGTVPPGGPGATSAPTEPQGGPQQSQTGTEQSYRSLETVVAPAAQGFVGQGLLDPPYILAPIAEYDLASLDLPHDPLNYVPYGAYDPPDTTLVANPSGQPVTRKPMNPTLNPTGLLQMPPMGIVDIHAAELLRGETPIDAIRVRVADITDYGPASLAEVKRIAGEIAAMGLDVVVVAGSSPQTVDVYVPAYDTSGTPPADLGWVEQHWTTLGAAPRVERVLGDTNLALVLLALFGAAVVAIGMQVLQASVRRRDAATMYALGWHGAQVLRWQVAESLAAGLAVMGAGALAWIPFGNGYAGLVVAIGGGALLTLAGLAAALTVRPRASELATGDFVPPPHRLHMTVTNIRAYALRSLVARPMRSLVIIVGLATAAAAIAPAAAVIVVVGAAVGPTALGSAVSARLQVYQLALLGIVGLSTLGFALLALQADLETRRRELRVLAACGWRPRQIGRLLAWTRLLIALPCASLAFCIAALTSGPIAGSTAPVAAVAALAGMLAFLTALAWGSLAGIRMRDC